METDGAKETLTKLNQAELPDFPGRKLTIMRSEVKNKLFVGNIPREVGWSDEGTFYPFCLCFEHPASV